MPLARSSGNPRLVVVWTRRMKLYMKHQYLVLLEIDSVLHLLFSMLAAEWMKGPKLPDATSINDYDNTKG